MGMEEVLGRGVGSRDGCIRRISQVDKVEGSEKKENKVEQNKGIIDTLSFYLPLGAVLSNTSTKIPLTFISEAVHGTEATKITP